MTNKYGAKISNIYRVYRDFYFEICDKINYLLKKYDLRFIYHVFLPSEDNIYFSI